MPPIRRWPAAIAVLLFGVLLAMGANAVPAAAATVVLPDISWSATTCNEQALTITEPLIDGPVTYSMRDYKTVVSEFSLPPGGSQTFHYKRPEGATSLNLVIQDKRGIKVGQRRAAWPACPTEVHWTAPDCGTKRAQAAITVPVHGRAGKYSLMVDGVLAASGEVAVGETKTLHAAVREEADTALTVTDGSGVTVGGSLSHILRCAQPAASASPVAVAGKTNAGINQEAKGGEPAPAQASKPRPKPSSDTGSLSLPRSMPLREVPKDASGWAAIGLAALLLAAAGAVLLWRCRQQRTPPPTNPVPPTD